MSLRGLTLLAYIAALTAIIVAGWLTFAGPAAAQYGQHDEITYIDQQAIDRWDRGDRFPNLPPVSTWHHAGYWCEPEQNPPEGWTRFGGFCQQIAFPDRMSLMFTGTDNIFGFKHN